MANSGGKNLFMAVLVLACAGLSVLAWWQHRRLEDLEARFAKATDAQTAVQKRLAAADARTAELETEAATLRARPAAAPAPAASTATTPQQPRRDSARGPANFAMMLNNPDFQHAMTASIRGSLDQRYATLFRKLKLAPAELEKLKNLLVDRQSSAFDVLAVTAGEGGPGGPENLRALMEKTQADVDEGIRSVLGDQRYAQYKDFDKNSASYSVSDQLERRLSYTQTPLAGAQADELVRILSENAPPAPTGGRAAGGFNPGTALIAPFMGESMTALATGAQPTISDQAMVQAKAILTPEQYTSLQQLQAEQQAMSQLLQMGRGQRPGGAAQGQPRP